MSNDLKLVFRRPGDFGEERQSSTPDMRGSNGARPITMIILSLLKHALHGDTSLTIETLYTPLHGNTLHAYAMETLYIGDTAFIGDSISTTFTRDTSYS